METTEFWNSYEQFKREMKAGDTNAARHTLYRMTQLYPHITDNDLMGNKAIIHCALALDRIIVNFNLAYFVPYAMRLADSDWEGERRAGRIVPSLGQRITNRLMSNLRERPDNYIKAIMPFFRKALQINPSNKDNLRHLAQLYARVALKSQAVKLYKRLLQRYHDSYLYAELADLLPTPQEKIALLTQAIVHQPKEAYRVGYRYRLAQLLQMPEPRRASYEIRKRIATRTKAGEPIAGDVDRIARLLQDFEPVTEKEQQAFYEAQGRIADRIINQ